MQAVGGEIRDRGEPHPAGFAVVHRDTGGDQHLALPAASVPAFGRIILAMQRDRGSIDLHQAFERRAAGGDHRPAQRGGTQPSRRVRSQPQLRPQLQGGDAV